MKPAQLCLSVRIAISEAQSCFINDAAGIPVSTASNEDAINNELEKKS
jgi:hypothetical protein